MDHQPVVTAVLFDLDGTLLPMDQNAFIHTYFGALARKVAPTMPPTPPTSPPMTSHFSMASAYSPMRSRYFRSPSIFHLPDAYYYDSLLMRKYNWIWTNILISLLAIAAAPCLFSAGFQTMVKRFLRLLFFLSGKTG